MTNSFSPNMLKTYEQCPKKFYFRYVENVNVPLSSTPFEKGKKIHALANYFLQGVNISRIETALTQEEKDVWNLLLGNQFFQKDYYNSEYQLSCKIGNYWVGGRLDAVVFDNDYFYVLDYKTGSIPKTPEFDYQTMIYLLSLDAHLANYSGLAFVYINLKDKKNYVIPFNDIAKSEYTKRILEICDKINSDAVYLCKLQNCQRCEYSKICPRS